MDDFAKMHIFLESPLFLELDQILHILPGESDTGLENLKMFTFHASNHLCSYPRSKSMSNNASLDVDHHDEIILIERDWDVLLKV